MTAITDTQADIIRVFHDRERGVLLRDGQVVFDLPSGPGDLVMDIARQWCDQRGYTYVWCASPRRPATRFATFVDQDGATLELEGASVQEIADQLPEDNLRPIRVVDEAGFVRGWATSPNCWSAA